MKQFFSPIIGLIPYQTLYVKPSYQVYNNAMGRDHFAQMYKNKSTRHDEEHDSIGFDKAITGLCGMLYSVVTLKAFFPSRAISADEISQNKITKD